MNKYLQRIVVTGSITEVREFIGLLAVLKTLCMTGSSRVIRLSVDGDGSADLNFYLDDDEGMTDLLDETRYKELPILREAHLPQLANGKEIELSIGE